MHEIFKIATVLDVHFGIWVCAFCGCFALVAIDVVLVFEGALTLAFALSSEVFKEFGGVQVRVCAVFDFLEFVESSS